MKTDADMINDFLKNKEATKCPDSDMIGDEKMYLKSKSHRTAHDYKLEPMWDGLVVYDNETDMEVTFSVNKLKTNGSSIPDIVASVTFTYNSGYAGINNVRENTITERISSGRYKIIEKAKG